LSEILYTPYAAVVNLQTEYQYGVTSVRKYIYIISLRKWD